MHYRILLSPHAAKAYRRAPSELKSRLDRAIEDISRSPRRGPQIKRLQGLLKEYYRYRIGDYRVLYTLSSERREVYIDYIQHRKDVYRG
ncbi:MAG: type II toxin-antitoxin system RelE/ParE family toxin [Candidatus Methylomirabilales bacterium]